MTPTSGSKMKRLLDIVLAGSVLVAAAPVLAIAAIGIKLTSPGPVLFRAPRIGRDRRRLGPAPAPAFSPERRRAGYGGREFRMYKFRTMHASGAAGAGGPITAANDPRVFTFGSWLRATKIDELPQLLNVLKNDMAFVGPRPEAPEIVREHYTSDDLTTLQVLPGVTSPGTLYYYTHGERLLSGVEVMELYLRGLLPVKMALDRVYIDHASVRYDIRLILRTIVVIVGRALGSRRFADPPELVEAGVKFAAPEPSKPAEA